MKKGYKFSKETKERMSKLAKERWKDKDFKKKMIKSLSGRKFSEETKRRMSISLKKALGNPEVRRKRSEAMKGKKNPMYGKSPSKEHRKKLSLSLKRRYLNKKEGISKEYSAFNIKDNKCKICGTSRLLEIHHIDGNHNNKNIDNLQVLCRKCHWKLHRTKINNRKKIITKEIKDLTKEILLYYNEFYLS